ncbi:MAG: hypothetical protein PHO48_00090 [Candidatus Gracilibacteria bacterium]|nr:hypothetical protein [Candidatus Gracilibacteria bacterium]MDD5178669.1 hypothetical protein [Candidatus Gracilibacteria bacterium]
MSPYSEEFDFWDYILSCFVIFGIPTLLYLFIVWNPYIGRNSDGEIIDLRIFVLAFVYWIMLFLIYKYKHPEKFN